MSYRNIFNKTSTNTQHKHKKTLHVEYYNTDMSCHARYHLEHTIICAKVKI